MENTQNQSIVQSGNPVNPQNKSGNGSSSTTWIILVIVLVLLICICSCCGLIVLSSSFSPSYSSTSSRDESDYDYDITPTKARATVTESTQTPNAKTEVYSNAKLGLKMNIPTISDRKDIRTTTKDGEYSVEIVLKSNATLTITRIEGGLGGTCSEDQKDKVYEYKLLTLKDGTKVYRLSLNTSKGYYEYGNSNKVCDIQKFPLKPEEKFTDEFTANYLVSADLNSAPDSVLQEIDNIVASIQLY